MGRLRTRTQTKTNAARKNLSLSTLIFYHGLGHLDQRISHFLEEIWTNG